MSRILLEAVAAHALNNSAFDRQLLLESLQACPKAEVDALRASPISWEASPKKFLACCVSWIPHDPAELPHVTVIPHATATMYIPVMSSATRDAVLPWQRAAEWVSHDSSQLVHPSRIAFSRACGEPSAQCKSRAHF